MPTPTSAQERSRSSLLDGLRGVAIVLVLLSHGWILWPTDRIMATPGIRQAFTSGDYAVSVFFVIGTFLTTRAMLRRAELTGVMLPGVAFVRRVIRLGGQMYFLLLAVLVVTALDTTDTYAETSTRESVVRAATFTWNWYVRSNTLEARPDLGHLWYLAVELQVFVLVVALVWLFRRRPGWLVVALGALLLSLLAWRAHVHDVEGPFSALVRTTARGDAPVTGALVAAALPFLGRLRPFAGRITVVSLLALVPLLFATADVSAYFHLPGVLLDLALAGVVVGASLAPAPGAVARIIGNRPMAFLGRHSLSLYLWHYPVFWFLSRHSASWEWEVRALVGFALSGVAALISERLVERRVQAALDSPRWRATDAGLLPYLLAEARSRLRRRPASPSGASDPRG